MVVWIFSRAYESDKIIDARVMTFLKIFRVVDAQEDETFIPLLVGHAYRTHRVACR